MKSLIQFLAYQCDYYHMALKLELFLKKLGSTFLLQDLGHPIPV